MEHSVSQPLLYITGTPLDKGDDKLYAKRIREWEGVSIVSGGSTAKVVARELGESVTIIPNARGVMLPPASQIPGVSIVSEGAITLGFVRDLLLDLADGDDLQYKKLPDSRIDKKIATQLLHSSKICFIVGTRLNEAHFDPSLPITLERRVDLIKELTKILRDSFQKNVDVEYL